MHISGQQQSFILYSTREVAGYEAETAVSNLCQSTMTLWSMPLSRVGLLSSLLLLSYLRYYQRAWVEVIVELANCEGAWLKKPYVYFWLEVGVVRKSQG